MERRRALGLIVAGGLLVSRPARADFAGDLLKRLDGLGGGDASRTQPSTSGLSQGEMDQGIRDALAKGVQVAVQQLGQRGGFLNDPQVRIPLPGNLQKVEGVLRSLRQDALADEFVQTMNHAAEQAVPEATDVFLGAIRGMSVEDASGIVTGPNDAATQYLRRSSTDELTNRFRPIVESATDRAGVTVAYKQMMDRAGPMAQMIAGETDLDGYITDKALDGLFLKIAEQERLIRADPAARTTDLLKKVFGNR
ncbi:DUF4197 domain-containing protein [Guyparkeria sp.]|uniref:DUF4197 domain-containing protein n=1 Tax=Guyparkeria sp. TaxID=2035736 RepID=UPI0035671C66